ncbi:hypothetical protein FLA_2561 [Filimonas lacunae]|nr:hypothetical protein FLA_2561 [Filimonas lacunae]
MLIGLRFIGHQLFRVPSPALKEQILNNAVTHNTEPDI